jgi:hypothetical protein
MEGLMKFPFRFKCDSCDEQHVSHFQAAFVLDTAGNWFFDLGKKKGWTGVTEEQHDALMDLFAQRVRPVCGSHEVVIDPQSGQRVFGH